jgi:hypothetical protein
LVQPGVVGPLTREENAPARGSFPDLGDEAAATEQAASVVDRFNGIFLRTLRALCHLRKVPPAVVMQNAGQVNVGGQHVNVNSPGIG